MPFALLAALGGSVFLHAAVLFYPDIEPAGPPEPILQAVLIIPAPAPVSAPPAAPPRPALRKRPASRPLDPLPSPALAGAAPVLAVDDAPPVLPDIVPVVEAGGEEKAPAPVIAQPLLPGEGGIRYLVTRGESGFEVGHAEQRWWFGDGRYRLRAVTQTSGLAALLKPVRVEMESEGRLVAGGLAPSHFRTWRNGQETNENADFDWERQEVFIARDASRKPLAPGAQDILSFHYQLAYLGELADGVSAGVATGKKFDTYRFEAVGEELIDTPAGSFRCLHLRVSNDAVTEIWLALERNRLPVKIRHTDKKGARFEQVAIELDQP